MLCEIWPLLLITEQQHVLAVSQSFMTGCLSGMLYLIWKRVIRNISSVCPGIDLAKRIIEGTGGSFEEFDYVLDDRSVEFWAGWVLAYLQWYTGMSFVSMTRKGLNIQMVMKMYPTFHEADVSKFVDSALRIMANSETGISALKRQRKSAGYTQQELSERSGVSLRMIRRIRTE